MIDILLVSILITAAAIPVTALAVVAVDAGAIRFFSKDN
jgi:hypothetical protein